MLTAMTVPCFIGCTVWLLARDNIAPVVVGEWGGKGHGSRGGHDDDRAWQDAFRAYFDKEADRIVLLVIEP